MEMEPSISVRDSDAVYMLSQRMRTFDIDIESRSAHGHDLNLKKKNKKRMMLKKNYNDEEEESELVELLRLIECPVCLEVPCPPIYNCCNGHFVCDNCRPRLHSQVCVFCFAQYTSMRNYPLEAIVSTSFVPCDFIKYGCNQRKLTLKQYEHHVPRCWAKIWCPGRVIQGKVTSSPSSEYESDSESFSSASDSNSEDIVGEDQSISKCPRCMSLNPCRKIKCKYCQAKLRPSTPMMRSPPSPYEFL